MDDDDQTDIPLEVQEGRLVWNKDKDTLVPVDLTESPVRWLVSRHGLIPSPSYQEIADQLEKGKLALALLRQMFMDEWGDWYEIRKDSIYIKGKLEATPEQIKMLLKMELEEDE